MAVKSPEAIARRNARKVVRARERYQDDPDFREKEKERVRLWRLENPERARRTQRVNLARRARDPEWVEKERIRKREYNRRKRAADPSFVERERARDREYYAQRKAMGVPTRRAPRIEPYYTAAAIVACFDRYEGVIASDSDRRLLAKLRSGERGKLTINQADDFLLRCGLGLYYIEEEP